MKRKTLVFIIAIIAAVLTISVLCGALFLKSARSGEALLKAVEKDFEQTPSLGKLVNLEVNCVLPWGQELGTIGFLPGDGIIQQGAITVKTGNYTARNRTKIITVPVKSYRTGKLELGSLQTNIERPWHISTVKKQTLSHKFPAMDFTALKVENPDQLPLADNALPPADKANKHFKYWLTIAGIVLALIVSAIYFWRRRKNRQLAQEILPPWEIAWRNLEELRKTADAGKQPLAWCVAKLSDVVRDYLSVRFSWKVSQQTTEEFFASLKRKSSPLSAAQTFYLEEFMKQSDLVKFANIKPDKDAFAQAVDRAGELVKQTGGSGEKADIDKSGEVRR